LRRAIQNASSVTTSGGSHDQAARSDAQNGARHPAIAPAPNAAVIINQKTISGIKMVFGAMGLDNACRNNAGVRTSRKGVTPCERKIPVAAARGLPIGEETITILL
jgi:hypothetical protein